MQVTDVPARSGGLWIKQAFALFRAQPTVWISLTSLWLMITLALFMVPGIGAPIGTILQPVFFAGLMRAAREQEEGRRATMALLFSALKTNGRALLVVGSITLLLELTILILANALGLPNIPFDAENRPDLNAFKALLAGKEWLIFSLFGLLSLVKGVLWFVPPLLAFNPMPATHALRWSFYAFIGNFSALVLLGLLMVGMFVLAMVPWGLGLMIAFPVFALANYTSYRQVFRDEMP
jgi:uncharacterized membrane protein